MEGESKKGTELEEWIWSSSHVTRKHSCICGVVLICICNTHIIASVFQYLFLFTRAPHSSRLGYDFDVVVENLNVTGSVQAVVVIDYEAPFPHIASITATFVRK